MTKRTMDPTIKALAAIKRDIRKIVAMAQTEQDKLTVIDFGERELAALRKEVVVGKPTSGGTLSASEQTAFGDLGKL